MLSLWQDLRYGLRMLLKAPAATGIAILALALGIGANTAIFSVVNAVLLRPLPYKDPERLVVAFEGERRGQGRGGVTAPDFVDWREQNQVFEGIAAWRGRSFTLIGSGQPERVAGTQVSASLFRLLGVEPLLGRGFLREEEDPGRDRNAVLSYGLWERRFGSDPNIVGQTLNLNGDVHTVVGVMPKSFRFNTGAELWTPLALTPRDIASTGSHGLQVVARLKPSISLPQAEAAMDTIARRLEQKRPWSNTNVGAILVPIHEQVVRGVRQNLYIFLGAVAFVLLIACVNVANLLLARATARQKEIAIRVALGAGRARLLRQLLTESVLLALVGGGLGVLLGMWGLDLILKFTPRSIPRAAEIGMDAGVLAFTFGLSIFTGILFGLAPGFEVARFDRSFAAFREEARSRFPLRHVLVASEMALALTLLIGAGLLLKSFHRLQQVQPGFNPTAVLAAQVSLPDSRYREAARQQAFYHDVIDRLAATPGVEAAGFTTGLPLAGPNTGMSFEVEGRPPAPPGRDLAAYYRAVTPGYFRALGVPLLKGRFFTERDTATTSQVVIINQRMARRDWPNEDPVGRRIRLDDGDQWKEIVAVTGDVNQVGLDSGAQPEMYVVFDQVPPIMLGLMRSTTMTLAIRVTRDPKDLISAVRQQVQAADPDVPVYNIRTMEDVISNSVSPQRFSTALLAIFAGIAVLLAAVGIYGVMSYAVSQQTREIGVRMALGAQPRDVLRHVVVQGMRVAVIGVAIGVAGSLALVRVLRNFLFGVSAHDPATFAAVSVLLAAVALVATYVPARRAAHVDPIASLRYE